MRLLQWFGCAQRTLAPVCLLLGTMLLLSACGFHLRQQAGLPFATLYLKSSNPDSTLSRTLRQSLKAQHVQLVDNAAQADVTLEILSETSDKQILSLGGSGRVEEYVVRYKVVLRAQDAEQNVWIADDEIELRRDYSYSDTRILAKEAEEEFLLKSMFNDMSSLIVQRLSRAKPQI